MMDDLRKELSECKKKTVIQRYRFTADIEGAKKIIKDNENISAFNIYKIPFSDECDEVFSEILDNPDLAKRARKALLDNFGAGK